MKRTTRIVGLTAGLLLYAVGTTLAAVETKTDTRQASATKPATSKPVKSAVIAVYNLRGELKDGPPTMAINLEMDGQQSLFRLLQRFRKIEKDD